MTFDEAVNQLYYLKEGDCLKKEDIQAVKIILNDSRVLFHNVHHEENYNY